MTASLEPAAPPSARPCFERTVRAASADLLRLARRVLGDDAEAQDAVQDALLSAFRAWDAYRGDAAPGTWLYRITLNAALRRRRRRQRWADVERGAGLGPSTLEPAWCRDPEAHLVARELGGLVRARIARLTVQHRDVLVLRDLEGLSTAQTARALGIRPGAVKVRLHRARHALRRGLGALERDEERAA